MNFYWRVFVVNNDRTIGKPFSPVIKIDFDKLLITRDS